MDKPLPIFRADFLNRSNTVRSVIFVSPSFDEALGYLKLLYGDPFVSKYLERLTKL